MEIWITTELEFTCSKCRANLEDGSGQIIGGVWNIEIVPCEDCLAEAFEKGKIEAANG